MVLLDHLWQKASLITGKRDKDMGVIQLAPYRGTFAPTFYPGAPALQLSAPQPIRPLSPPIVPPGAP